MAIENESDTFDIGGELTVHRLGFGAMRITGPDILGEPADVENARAVLQRALDLGVDFIDTADSYGPGTSERLIADALAPYPDDLVVATKGGLLRTPNGDWRPLGDPDYLANEVLVSRDRLGVETIDLYQFHRPDPDVPFVDSVTRLAELKDEGYIRHVGLSNVSVDQLATARDVVDVATVQNRYNVANRESEDVLEMCERYGIGFIPWYPLGAGSLNDVAETIDDVAQNHGATRQQVAIAWLLQHSPVTLPIPGTASVDHLEDNIAASSLELTDAEMARLADSA